MRKKPQIIRKPDPTELQIQNRIEFQFLMAIMNKDIQMLNALISDNGHYFGNRNKWNVLHFFKVQFDNWELNEDDNVHFEIFINMKNKCGHNAIMIENGKFPMIGNNNKSKAFTLGISENQINYIDICYKFISMKEADEMVTSN